MATLAETGGGGGGGAGLTGRNGDSMAIEAAGVSGVQRIVAVELPLSGVDARLVSILITGILSCRLRNPFLLLVASETS